LHHDRVVFASCVRSRVWPMMTGRFVTQREAIVHLPEIE
jgi:hypothetical protein